MTSRRLEIDASISGKSCDVAFACVSSESNSDACLHASITRRRISASPEGLPMWFWIEYWMASISVTMPILARFSWISRAVGSIQEASPRLIDSGTSKPSAKPDAAICSAALSRSV